MMPSPQERVLNAIALSRVGLGLVEPLSDAELAQLVDCLERIGVPASAERYKGWVIQFEYGWFTGVGPNFEGDYQGEEQGWVGNGEMVSARTIADVRIEIDAKLAEVAA